MNRQFLFSLCIWTVASATSTVLRADIIFSDFGGGFAYNTSVGNVVGNGFDGNDYAEGDTFTPAATSTFSLLDIALSCLFACPDTFNVSLTNNSGDRPATVLESFTVAGSSLGSLGSNNAPVVLSSVLDPVLAAGTQYWIIVASDLNNTIEWNMNSTGNMADQATSTDDAVTWFSPSGQTPGAFAVNGVVSTVPEPGSAGLLLCAAMLCGIVRIVSQSRARVSHGTMRADVGHQVTWQILPLGRLRYGDLQ